MSTIRAKAGSVIPGYVETRRIRCACCGMRLPESTPEGVMPSCVPCSLLVQAEPEVLDLMFAAFDRGTTVRATVERAGLRWGPGA